MTKNAFDFQKPPLRIFRYFPSKASDIFSSQKLWVSAAKDFNDIFEVVPRYDSLVSSKIREGLRRQYAFLPPDINVAWHVYEKLMKAATAEIYSETIEVVPQGFQDKFSEHFGIVCFSENPSSLLMWGHYADCHRGFVVEFDPDHAMFSGEEFGKVAYAKERPNAEFVSREYWRVLLTKSPEWQYESEHRLIKVLNTLQKATRRDGVEKHYINLAFDAVRAVYFGCRMPNEVRDEIVRNLKRSEWQHVAKFGMRRHESEYALQAQPWEKLKSAPPAARKDFDELWPGFNHWPHAANSRE